MASRERKKEESLNTGNSSVFNTRALALFGIKNNIHHNLVPMSSMAFSVDFLDVNDIIKT